MQTFKAVGAVAETSGTNLSLPQPALVAGDYCVAFLYVLGGTAAPSVPGYSSFFTTPDGVGGAFHMLWRLATSTVAEANISATVAGASYGQVVVASGASAGLGAPTAIAPVPAVGVTYYQTGPITATDRLGVGFGGMFNWGGSAGSFGALTNQGAITSVNTLRSSAIPLGGGIGHTAFTMEIATASGGTVRGASANNAAQAAAFAALIPANPATVDLAGAAELVSSATGVVTSQLPASGVVAVTSSASGTLSDAGMGGTVVATSLASGAVTSRLPAVGVTASSSSAGGDLTASLTPTGLTATGGEGGVHVSFNPVTGADGYVLEWRRTDLARPAATIQSSPPKHLDRLDQPNLPLNGQYQQDFTGEGVRIYFPDSGVRITHQDFTGRVLTGIGAGWDVDSLPYPNGHGTVVASVALGSIHGVAKGALLVSVKAAAFAPAATTTLTPAEFTAVVDAILSHANGAEGVVTISFWFTGAQSAIDSQFQRLLDAGLSVTWLANYDGAQSANATDVIVAGGIRVDDVRDDPRSGWGPGVDVYAVTNGSMMGSAISNTAEFLADGGTSVAAPQVAGVLAKIIEANPGLPPARRREVVLSQAWEGKLADIPSGPNRLLNSDANTDQWSDHVTTDTDFEFALAPGAYEFRVSSVTDGDRSAPSPIVTATVANSHPASGMVESASSAIGQVTSRLPASGVSANVTFSSGGATATLAASGSIGGTTAASGEIASRLPASGTVEALSSAIGDMTVPGGLNGAITAASTVIGSVTSRLPASGAVDASSAITGATTLHIPTAGTVASASSVTGAMEPQGGLSGTVLTVSAVTGRVTARLPFTGSIHAVSAIAGRVAGRMSASGTAASASSATGSLSPSGGYLPFPDVRTLTGAWRTTLDPVTVSRTLTSTPVHHTLEDA